MARAARDQGLPIDQNLAGVLLREVQATPVAPAMRLRRLLGLLSEVGGDGYAVPHKSVLLSHPDAYVRSKAALMIGRATKNAALVSRRMLDADPRVQANAVQSMWGVDAPEWRAVLESALRSSNNRVLANVLIGFYQINDVSSIAKLFAMAAHAEEAFRVSARWAMGETGDPRFIPYLKAALLTDSGKCHAMDIRSMARLRRRLAALEHPGLLPVDVWEKVILPGNLRRIGFSPLRGQTDNRVVIGPMNLMLAEGGDAIHDYTLTALPEPQRLVVGFAVPRITSDIDPYRVALLQGFERCLEVKPKRDLWSIDRYRFGETSDAEPPADLPIAPEDLVLMNHLRNNNGYLTDPQIITRLVSRPGPKEKASVHMEAGMRRLMDAVARTSGTHDVFVLAEPEHAAVVALYPALVETAVSEGTRVHALAPHREAGYGHLRDLCRSSGGVFETVRAEDVAARLPAIYQALRNRYEIVYQSARAEPGVVEMTVYSTEGWNRSMFSLSGAG